MPIANSDASEDEREFFARTELAARMRRARLTVRLALAILAFIVGLPGFFWARDIQLRWLGAHWTWLSALIGFGLPGMLATKAEQRLSSVLFDRSVNGWIEQIAAQWRVPIPTLELRARVLRGIVADDDKT